MDPYDEEDWLDILPDMNKIICYYDCFKCGHKWTKESYYMDDDNCPECGTNRRPYRAHFKEGYE